MFKFIIKTFDQVKNDNFNQVKFDQVINSHVSYLRKFLTDKEVSAITF
jgi:hypothetical protein